MYISEGQKVLDLSDDDVAAEEGASPALLGGYHCEELH